MMKKVICVFLSIILFFVLGALAINMSIQEIIVDTLSDVIVKEQVKDTITDYVYENESNIDDEQLEKIEDFINSNEDIKNITDKYFQGIMDSVSGKEGEELKISEDLNKLIENNRDKLKEFGVSDEKIDSVKEEIENNEDINNVYNEVRDNVSNNLTEEQKMVIDVYNFCSSKSLRYGLIAGIIGIGIIILLLLKNVFKTLLYMGVSTLISGILIRFGMVYGINLISWALTNDVIGQTSNINTDILVNIGYIYIGLGIGGIVLGIIFGRDKKQQKRL